VTIFKAEAELWILIQFLSGFIDFVDPDFESGSESKAKNILKIFEICY
jgi:hypothetical protein